MAPEGDWILLSTAVVRMAELSPAYRLRPGLAHRDLEYAIRADRVELRGHPIGARAGPPVAVPRPISPGYEVNLHHNTILLRRPGHSGAELLFRDVEIEWTSARKYLGTILAASASTPTAPPSEVKTALANSSGVATAKVGAPKRGRRPKKLEEVKSAMRDQIQRKLLSASELKNMYEKELPNKFNASRTTCRDARKAILTEFVGNSIPDK
jgi:hypothetical protein